MRKKKNTLQHFRSWIKQKSTIKSLLTLFFLQTLFEFCTQRYPKLKTFLIFFSNLSNLLPTSFNHNFIHPTFQTRDKTKQKKENEIEKLKIFLIFFPIYPISSLLHYINHNFIHPTFQTRENKNKTKKRKRDWKTENIPHLFSNLSNLLPTSLL